MNLRIKNKVNFIQKFLIPISKINDLCTLVLDNNSISNLNRTPDSNFSLYITSDEIEYSGEKRNLSFADIKKFIKIIDCIQSESVDLVLNENNIEYKSNGTRFKFHLINDNIVKSPNFNIDKINSLEFNNEFKINLATYNSLLKSSLFITDSSKIYLNTEDGKMMAELTDKTKSNIDSYTMEISDGFIGESMSKPLAFDFDIFRIISFLKTTELCVKLNTTRGIIAFDIEDNNYKLKYITTAKVS